jgi:hypothetical protein
VRRSTNDSQFLLDAPRLVFQVRPVVRVEGAVRGELEVIAWRDCLKGKWKSFPASLLIPSYGMLPSRLLTSCYIGYNLI